MMTPNTTILILGASSYIGEQLYKRLRPYHAIGTHNANGLDGTVYFDATAMDVSQIIPDTSAISHCFIIFAEADVDACKADLERSHNLNVIAVKNIINTLVIKGIKPIFMSSEYVFNGETGNYIESDPATPNTVYGSQKREIERYLEQVDTDYTILRLAKVYGSDPTDRTILSNWTRQVRKGERITCASNQVFSAIHIDDVVSASISALRLDLSGVFHVAGPSPCSRLEMLRTLIKQLRSDADILECRLQDLTFLDNRPVNLSMNASLIQSITGLQFRSVKDSCREFVSNLRNSESSF